MYSIHDDSPRLQGKTPESPAERENDLGFVAEGDEEPECAPTTSTNAPRDTWRPPEPNTTPGLFMPAGGDGESGGYSSMPAAPWDPDPCPATLSARTVEEVLKTPYERWGQEPWGASGPASVRSKPGMFLAAGCDIWAGLTPKMVGGFILPYGFGPTAPLWLKVRNKLVWNQAGKKITAKLIQHRRVIPVAIAFGTVEDHVGRLIEIARETGLDPMIVATGTTRSDVFFVLADDEEDLEEDQYIDYALRAAAALGGDPRSVKAMERFRAPGVRCRLADESGVTTVIQTLLHFPPTRSVTREQLDLLPPVSAIMKLPVLRGHPDREGFAHKIAQQERADGGTSAPVWPAGWRPDASSTAIPPAAMKRDASPIAASATLVTPNEETTTAQALGASLTPGTSTSIYCPKGTHARASALLIRGHRGDLRVQCDQCGARWPVVLDHEATPAGVQARYDALFGPGDQRDYELPPIDAIETAPRTPFDIRPRLPEGLESIKWRNVVNYVVADFDPAALARSIDQRYAMGDLPQAVIAVRAPLGVGKTQLIQELRERTRGTNRTIHVAVHQVSLARTAAQRLDLPFYAEDDVRSVRDRFKTGGGGVTTIDSLRKWDMSPDYLVIDEASGGIKHLVGAGTLKAAAKRALRDLATRVSKARIVILLDADLDGQTIEAVLRLYAIEGIPSPAPYLINVTGNALERSVYFTQDRPGLIHRVLHLITAGKRVAVCCTRRSTEQVLERMITNHMVRLGLQPPAILRIDGENSGTPQSQEALRDPNNEKAGFHIGPDGRQYQALFFSPSVATGVNFTARNWVHEIIGFAEPGGPDAAGFWQMTARVRFPVSTQMVVYAARTGWATSQTDIATLRQEAIARTAVARRGAREVGKAERDETGDNADATHLQLWAALTVAYRKGQRQYADALMERLRLMGVPYVTPTDGIDLEAPPAVELPVSNQEKPSSMAVSLAPGCPSTLVPLSDLDYVDREAVTSEIKEATALAKLELKKARIEAVVCARVLDDAEANQIRIARTRTPEDTAALKRHSATKFYGVSADPAVAAEGDDGGDQTNPEPIRWDEDLCSFDAQRDARTRISNLARVRVLLDGDRNAAMLCDIRRLTDGLAARTTIDGPKCELVLRQLALFGIDNPLTHTDEYEKESLCRLLEGLIKNTTDGDPSRWVAECAAPVARVCGFEVPKNILSDPVKWVGKLLKVIGLAQIGVQVRVPGSEKKKRGRVYSIDATARELTLRHSEAQYQRLVAATAREAVCVTDPLITVGGKT